MWGTPILGTPIHTCTSYSNDVYNIAKKNVDYRIKIDNPDKPLIVRTEEAVSIYQMASPMTESFSGLSGSLKSEKGVPLNPLVHHCSSYSLLKAPGCIHHFQTDPYMVKLQHVVIVQ